MTLRPGEGCGLGEPVGSPSRMIRRPGRLSLAGCSPAEPASVSPAGWIIGVSFADVKSWAAEAGSLSRMSRKC